MARAVTSPAAESAGCAPWPQPARWQQRSLLAASRQTPLLLPVLLDRAVPHLAVPHHGADVHGFPRSPQLDRTRGRKGWPRDTNTQVTPGLDQSRISGNTAARRVHPPTWITSLSKTFQSHSRPKPPDQGESLRCDDRHRRAGIRAGDLICTSAPATEDDRVAAAWADQLEPPGELRRLLSCGLSLPFSGRRRTDPVMGV